MRKYFLVLFFLCQFLTSCIKDGENKETFKRTVIAYLGRDDRSLLGAREEKIASMVKGWDGKNGNLIIFQDTSQYIGNERITGNACLMKVVSKNGVNTVETIEEYGETNSADSEIFGKVLNKVIKDYPADSYGLIIFSHSTGWLPYSSDLRSIIYDQKSQMKINDLANAIPAGYFDFIVFEACYTAGIEVAYQLKDKTNYIFASSAEVISPGYIDVYANSMNYFFEREPRLKSFAENIFNYISTSDQHFYAATFSLIKTSELNDLATFLKNNIDKHATVNIAEIQHFGRSSLRYIFYDFEDYFSRVLKPEASRQEFSSILERCLAYKNYTPNFLVGWGGFNINHHSGLTTYISQERYPYLNEEYKKLDWYKAVFEE